MGIIGLIVLLIVVVIFHKELAFIGWIVILACVGAFGYYQFDDWRQSKLHENVHISVRYDLQACNEKFPILTTITNKNENVLLRYRWQVAAFVPGRSSNLVPLKDSQYSADFILHKLQSNTHCRPLPNLEGSAKPETLNWNAWLYKEHLIFGK